MTAVDMGPQWATAGDPLLPYGVRWLTLESSQPLPGGQSAQTLVIAVMGASMAAGAMNCNACVICNGTNLAPHLAWPRKLQERLSAAVPRCRVEVSVLGYGGTTSETSPEKDGAVLWC